MKKLVLFAWVSCMLLVPGLIARSGFPYLPASYIPENVQWVLHVDMKRLRAAEVGALLEDKHLDWVTEVNQEMIDEFRINLVDKTTGITVFGTHRERRNSVMLLSGDFDRKFIVSRLEKLEGYKIAKYGKYTIHKFKNSGFCTFLNDELLMFSMHSMDEDALGEVTDVLAGKKKNLTASKLMAVINGLPDNAFLTAVAEDISLLADDDEASLFLKKTGLAFFVAGEKEGNLRMTCKLITDTPETARNIQEIINGFKAMARMKLDEKGEGWMILEKLDLRVSGNQLELDLEYPSKDIIEMVGSRRYSKKHSH